MVERHVSFSQAFPVNTRQKVPHPGRVHFNSQEARLGKGFGNFQGRFAVAESNFHHMPGTGRKQRPEIRKRRNRNSVEGIQLFQSLFLARSEASGADDVGLHRSVIGFHGPILFQKQRTSQ